MKNPQVEVKSLGGNSLFFHYHHTGEQLLGLLISAIFYTLSLRRYLSEPPVEATLFPWMARCLLDKGEFGGERASSRNSLLEDGVKQVGNDFHQDESRVQIKR